MKTYRLPFFCTLFILAAVNTVQAQPRIIEQTLNVEPDGRIELNLKFGNQIVIKAWDRPEVLFRATADVNNGRLNDAFLIDFYQNGKARIEMDFDREKIRHGRTEDCPGKNYSYYDNHVVCSDITYEIYLPRDADLSVETISANIELFGLHGLVSVKSISGYVDMSWPERDGAELSIKTISGGVYSDLENIEFRNKGKFAPVGVDIRAKAGTGNTPVRLETISGDIFLRRGS
ncbi:MAG: hypothetical protein ACFCU6_07775 [Balneolaceae bacterium]